MLIKLSVGGSGLKKVHKHNHKRKDKPVVLASFSHNSLVFLGTFWINVLAGTDLSWREEEDLLPKHHSHMRALAQPTLLIIDLNMFPSFAFL